MSRKLCVWSWITFSIILETKEGRKSNFEPFLNSGFNFAILQSNGNIEYFIDKLQIWEMSLAKTVALSFKYFPDRLSSDYAELNVNQILKKEEAS